jgi:replication factor A1
LCDFSSLAVFLVAAGSSGTNWKTFADVKAQNLGQDKAEFFTSKGTVVFMKKENCMYMVSYTQYVAENPATYDCRIC